MDKHAHYVVSTVHVADLPDPDDSPFLEVALSAGVPLVTGNIRDYPANRRRSAEIFTPTRFLEQRMVSP